MTIPPSPPNQRSKPGPKPGRELGIPIAVRIRPDHLARLDEYAKAKGIFRASAIQIAIAELLERFSSAQ